MTATNGVPPDQLRLLVREVLAEVVGNLPPRQPAAARTHLAVPAAPPSSVPRADADGASRGAAPVARHPRSGPARSDDASWRVLISTDEDLHAFVLRVLKLAGNPKLRQDLISGRARFRLAEGSAPSGAPGPAAVQPAMPVRGGDPPGPSVVPVRGGDPPGPAVRHRVDKGAVTERMVAAAAAAGARLVLGPRAVLTPLARDKARALGVPIEKER